MDWIRLNVGFPRHPKVRKLARRLGVPVPVAGWAVVNFLTWVAVTRETGDLSGLDAEDLAAACDWDGDPEALVAALEGSGFVDASPEGVRTVHDWMAYQGLLLAARERKRRWRERPTGDGDVPGTFRRRSGGDLIQRTTNNGPPPPARAEARAPAREGRDLSKPAEIGLTSDGFRQVAASRRAEALEARKKGNRGDAIRLHGEALVMEGKAIELDARGDE